MRVLIFLLIFSFSLFSFELSKNSVIVSKDIKVAKELKNYLDRIVGGDIKIVDKKDKDFIYLTREKSLPNDAFILDFSDANLTIKAKNERGLFYGCYFFLEHFLGCKFLTKDIEEISHLKSIKFKNQTLKRVPYFSYREIFSSGSEDMTFATKLALNGRLGHRVWQKSSKLPRFRRIYNIFSSRELISDRFECNGQYEFSNIDVKKEAVNNLKKKLADIDVENDDYIYIQHEDRGSFCDDRYDFLDYVKYLAKHIDKNILFEAYQWSSIPPKNDPKLPKNLSIFFSTIEANFAKSLTSSENKAIYKNLKKWNTFNHDIIIWHYITNFGGYLQPTPNIYQTANHIKSFSKLKNISGVFLQGAYDCQAGELEELRTWVFAKLLWNPNQNIDSLIKTFCDNYYKEASVYVQKYVKALDILSKKLDRRLYVKTSVDLGYLKRKYLRYLESILDKAYRVAKDKEIKRRVLKLYSAIDYVRVIKGWANDAQKRRFENFLKRYDIKNYAEGRDVKGLFDLLKLSRKPSTPPKAFKGLAKGKNWFEYQEYALKLCCTKYAKDPKSSDGVSAYMDGDQSDWGFQLDILNLPKGKWDVYASVKVIKNGSITSNVLPAIHYGVDPSSKGVYFTAQFKDGVYKDIKLATVDTSKSSDNYIWLSPAGNSAIKRVYVDRFFIVKVK